MRISDWSSDVCSSDLLAALSKESGTLLPLFALCLELTVLASITKPPHWKSLGFLLLGVPSLALGAYFLFKFPDLLSGYQRRDFSMVQRVLTDGRVMLAYLHDLAVPSFSSASVFPDGFPISPGRSEARRVGKGGVST